MSKKEVDVKNIVVSIDELLANDLNPRKISRKKYEALKKSLLEFPEMKKLREVVVDENMTILAGHQRVYALQELEYENIDVKQVFNLTDAQKRRFMVLDNDHSGEWDFDIIANEWDVPELKDWGINSIKIPGMPNEPGIEDVSFSAKKPHDVNCPNCGFQFDPKDKD